MVHSMQKMWWLIAGDVVAHCWRCGGSLLEMWWLIVGYVVAHCWSCAWWLIYIGDVLLIRRFTRLLGQRSRDRIRHLPQ